MSTRTRHINIADMGLKKRRLSRSFLNLLPSTVLTNFYKEVTRLYPASSDPVKNYFCVNAPKDWVRSLSLVDSSADPDSVWSDCTTNTDWSNVHKYWLDCHILKAYTHEGWEDEL